MESIVRGKKQSHGKTWAGRGVQTSDVTPARYKGGNQKGQATSLNAPATEKGSWGSGKRMPKG